MYAHFRDAAGNLSAVYSDTIILDATSPTDRLQINDGATYTPIRAVTLTLDAQDVNGVTAMRCSSDGLTFGAWLPYSSTHTWQLAEGNGTHAVYVQYQDTAGNISPSYSEPLSSTPCRLRSR